MPNFRTLEVAGHDPVRIFADDKIFDGLDVSVFTQARNTACTCGVEHVAILPDAHQGYGAPIGSVVVSKTRVIGKPKRDKPPFASQYCRKAPLMLCCVCGK